MPYNRYYYPHYSRDNRLLSRIHEVDYYPHMVMTFAQALKQAMDARNMSLRKIADLAGVSYEQLKKVNQGKSQSTNVDDAQRVAAALSMSLDQFLNGEFTHPPTITIAGKVGAGAKVPVFDTYEKGAGPQIECPPGLSPHGIVAVEIVGDSMEPVYSAGDLLFYSRNSHDGVPDDVIGHRCVCEDENGLGWVKQVKRGSEPGLFNLISLNPGADNMHDVRLKWAARVRLHWPVELTKNYEEEA